MLDVAGLASRMLTLRQQQRLWGRRSHEQLRRRTTTAAAWLQRAEVGSAAGVLGHVAVKTHYSWVREMTYVSVLKRGRKTPREIDRARED